MKEIINVKIHCCLEEIMKEQGVTRRDLQRDFGWGPSRIAQYISGQREPDYATMFSLAYYLGVSVSDIWRPFSV